MYASIIFINGNIVTMDNGIIAEAVAVDKDSILYVGDNEAAIEYLSDDTRVVDLKGKTIIPGSEKMNDLKCIGDILKMEADSNRDLHIYDVLEELISHNCNNSSQGLIREGYLADFIVLDSNPLVVSMDMLEFINVVSVYMKGNLVYDLGR